MSDTRTDPTTTELPPVVKIVDVACSTRRAFELFTGAIGEWWPLATHSVYGDDARSVRMGEGVGTEIIETSASGERTPWGTITTWEPGRELGFTWYPGRGLDEATEVTVRFAASERGTRVELVHRGFERRQDPEGARASYETGWVPVLARFAARAAAA